MYRYIINYDTYMYNLISYGVVIHSLLTPTVDQYLLVNRGEDVLDLVLFICFSFLQYVISELSMRKERLKC